MSIKKIAARILRYLSLALFVFAMFSALYGIRKLDRGQFRKVFPREGIRV